MTLLVIILVFIAQRFLRLGEKIQRIIWLKSYLSFIQSLLQKTNLWNHLIGIIIILLPFLLLFTFLQWLLHGWILGILRFFLDFFVLWFCLDAYQLKQQLGNYFSALASKDLNNLHQESLKIIRDDQRTREGEIQNLSGLARAMTCEIFLRADEKLFGVLFWFALLGSVGAVLYFLIVSICDIAVENNSPFVELLLPANRVFGILNWIPVRVLGLSYALVGYFISAFHYVRKNFSKGIDQTTDFAIQVGFAGLNMEHYDVIHADLEENQAALSLVDRTVYLWIVVIAIFTLGGWL